MNGKTYEGTIINGQVRLLADVQLPENIRVLVFVPDESEAFRGRVHTPHLAHPEQSKEFEMEVEEARDAGPT